MSEVKSLFGGPCHVKEADANVVEMAQKLLDLAEAGEIAGFAAAVLYYDRMAGVMAAGFVGNYQMAGALEDLKLMALEVK